jgi:hypothetical protein
MAEDPYRMDDIEAQLRDEEQGIAGERLRSAARGIEPRSPGSLRPA